jgi:hypothetical protein
MTTPAVALAGTTRSAARAPYHCVACGEPLFTRALACPHCGAPDPVAAEAPRAEDRATPVAAETLPAADLPAGDLSAGDLPAEDLPAVAAAAPFDADVGAPPNLADGPAPSVAAEPDYAELEPMEPVPAGPVMPRAPRPPSGSARLDIAPEPYEDDLSDSRDLVLVPERGGRTVMLPEPRRRGRFAGVLVAGLVVIGIGAAAMFGWRMLSGPAAMAAREVTVDTAWTSVPLEAVAGAGEWVVTADAPFRIRVDGAVYTVGAPSGIAIPLDGREVAVRAISGATKVTFVRR